MMPLSKSPQRAPTMHDACGPDYTLCFFIKQRNKRHKKKPLEFGLRFDSTNGFSEHEDGLVRLPPIRGLYEFALVPTETIDELPRRRLLDQEWQSYITISAMKIPNSHIGANWNGKEEQALLVRAFVGVSARTTRNEERRRRTPGFST